MRGIRAHTVLAELDAGVRGDHGVWFPDFDHGYNYHVDARLSVYADAVRWAIVIEHLTVNPRADYFAGVSTTLYFQGNCISIPDDPTWGDRPVRSVNVLSDGPSGHLLVDEEEIDPEVWDVTIRGVVVPFSRDPNYYASRGMHVERLTDADIDERIASAQRHLQPKEAEEECRWYEQRRAEVGCLRLRPEQLLRGMVPKHRDLLLATEAERRVGLPADLPLLLQLNDWVHPRLLERELPSQSPSFQMIADVIDLQDALAYTPIPGNVHWSNWPRSGWL